MVKGTAEIYNSTNGWGWIFDLRDKPPMKWRKENYKTMHEAYIAMLEEMIRITLLERLDLQVKINNISLKEDTNIRDLYQEIRNQEIRYAEP